MGSSLLTIAKSIVHKDCFLNSRKNSFVKLMVCQFSFELGALIRPQGAVLRIVIKGFDAVSLAETVMGFLV
ncbi:hypothetical protein BMI76_09815 [Streptococcus sp. 'caviae']|nr:hypothetical protein BMI76_09815 [Streptococcus sp. 'caviae']